MDHLVFVNYKAQGLRLIAYSDIDATEKYEEGTGRSGSARAFLGRHRTKGRGKAAEAPLSNLESIGIFNFEIFQLQN